MIWLLAACKWIMLFFAGTATYTLLTSEHASYLDWWVAVLSWAAWVTILLAQRTLEKVQ